MPEPTDMMNALTESMLERTGRSTAEWVAMIRAAEGLDALDQSAVRAWLKTEHGLKQNTQWALAFAAASDAGWVEPDVDGYSDRLYSGPKAALRPLHDAVAALALECGKDVEAQGRSTYIPFIRKTQFAAIAPGPRGTLRVGIRLRQPPKNLDSRFEPTKNFAQATHWTHLDGETPATDVASMSWLMNALREAYSQNG